MRGFSYFHAAVAAAVAVAVPAHAEDEVIIAPPAAWVKPVALPAKDDAPVGEMPLKFLLSDQQVNFERERTTSYVEYAFKIESAQGLSAGNISLPWRKDLDVLTVHKVLIHRDGKTIDVLASGQKFTVIRRETNLEIAMLDGMLTANLQPEGLQAGDVLQVAFTLASSDPTFKGNVEEIGAVWNGIPIARAHFRAQWPQDMDVKIRAAALPPVKPVGEGKLQVVELSLDDVQPLNPPKGAPSRFAMGRMLEFSSFDSWADVAALLAPLYESASRVSPKGQLKAEVERLRASSRDPKKRAEAALALVQDRVRYVALLMGVGGLVPADAETTWSRRFGDCKGKTALLIALLHELGIEAEPVAVNAFIGDGIDERLPMIGLFNHVIVRARIGGRTYWMDGTGSGDLSLDRLRVPNYRWGLPVTRAKSALVRMVPPPLDVPDDEEAIVIDARGGITTPAPFKVEAVFRGDGANSWNQTLKQMPTDRKERYLIDHWRDQFDFVEPKTVSSAFDPATGEMRLTMEGSARMEWNEGWYQTDHTSVGYRADFSRHPGPSADAPLAVPYPSYSRTTETILLPPAFEGSRLREGANVDVTVAGIEYKRTAGFEGSTFKIVKSERTVVPEFPFAEGAAAQAKLRELANKAVFLRRPPRYVPTEAEKLAGTVTGPTSVEDLLNRGHELLEIHRFDEAIADFDKGLAIEPKHAYLLANRGMARAWKREFDAAKADLDAALALDPDNEVAYRGRGWILQQSGKCAEAIAAYTKSLEQDPNNVFGLGKRAECYRVNRDHDKALADAADAIKVSKTYFDMYLLQANIHRIRNNEEGAIAVANAVVAANPGSDYAFVMAAKIHASLDNREEAMRQFERALAIKPAAYIYVNRSSVRAQDDVAGRRADLEEALKLDPNSMDALLAKAYLLEKTKDHAGVVAIYSQMIAMHGAQAMFLVERGLAYGQLGKMDLAEKDFAAASAVSKHGHEYNNACWMKATAGMSLQSALADCEAAIAKSPDMAAFLDSYGFVLLRLNRIDEAIAAYDKALARSPKLAPSLYGRAIAWARKGDKQKSEADAAAATAVDSGIRTRFEGFGVTL
jgi:tetratricopeptide (TPR) repeat protein